MTANSVPETSPKHPYLRWVSRVYGLSSHVDPGEAMRRFGLAVVLPLNILFFVAIGILNFIVGGAMPIVFYFSIITIAALILILMWSFVSKETHNPTVVYLFFVLCIVTGLHSLVAGVHGLLVPLILLPPCLGYFFLGRAWGVGLGFASAACIFWLFGVSLIGDIPRSYWPTWAQDFVRTLVLLLVTFCGVIAAMAGHEALKTKRRQLTKALAAAQEANQAKSVFLSDMSHDLRTPLAGIVGNLDLLRRSTTLGPSQRELLDSAEESANNLQLIVTSLLDLDRIDARSREAAALNPLKDTNHGTRHASATARFDDLVIIADTTAKPVLSAASQSAVSEKGAIVEEELVDLEGIRAMPVDTRGLEALDASMLANRAISTPQPADSARIDSNADTVAPEEEDAEPTDQLGPEDSVRADESAHELSEPAPHQPLHRVLVADDHPVNREILQRMISATGGEVVLVEDGLAAVNLAMTEPFDLLFFDIRMPGLDGIDALARIRTSGGPNRLTSAVAVTANAFPEQQKAYRDAGFSSVVVKPFRLADITQAIEIYARRE